MPSLSVITAPCFSGVPSVGTLPSQNGVHSSGLDGLRVSWSMGGERPLQFTVNPQLLQPAATPKLLQPAATLRLATPQPRIMTNFQTAMSYLLGQQISPINGNNTRQFP